MPDTEILTAGRLAVALKIKLPTVRKWQTEGLPYLAAGRLRRYRLEAVVAWLDQREAARLQEGRPPVKRPRAGRPRGSTTARQRNDDD
jgi:phage terminase Nu1 subunit (DNA packaging protein)